MDDFILGVVSSHTHRVLIIGAQMVKEVASQASDEAGDGTTTATVLAQAIIRCGVDA